MGLLQSWVIDGNRGVEYYSEYILLQLHYKPRALTEGCVFDSLETLNACIPLSNYQSKSPTRSSAVSSSVASNEPIDVVA